jgi:hypothetical protein
MRIIITEDGVHIVTRHIKAYYSETGNGIEQSTYSVKATIDMPGLLCKRLTAKEKDWVLVFIDEFLTGHSRTGDILKMTECVARAKQMEAAK